MQVPEAYLPELPASASLSRPPLPLSRPRAWLGLLGDVSGSSLFHQLSHPENGRSAARSSKHLTAAVIMHQLPSRLSLGTQEKCAVVLRCISVRVCVCEASLYPRPNLPSPKGPGLQLTSGRRGSCRCSVRRLSLPLFAGQGRLAGRPREVAAACLPGPNPVHQLARGSLC